MPIRVNGQRINGHLSALSKFGANPQGGVSCVAYSEADLQGREYAVGLMKKAGLDVHIDAALMPPETLLALAPAASQG